MDTTVETNEWGPDACDAYIKANDHLFCTWEEFLKHLRTVEEERGIIWPEEWEPYDPVLRGRVRP